MDDQAPLDTSSPACLLPIRFRLLSKCMRNLEPRDAAVIQQAMDDLEHEYSMTSKDQQFTRQYSWDSVFLELERASNLVRIATKIDSATRSFTSYKEFRRPPDELYHVRNSVAMLTISLFEGMKSFTGYDFKDDSILARIVWESELREIRNECAHAFENRITYSDLEETDHIYSTQRHFRFLIKWLPQMIEPPRDNLRSRAAWVRPCISYEVAHWDDEFRAYAQAEEEARLDLKWTCRCTCPLTDGFQTCTCVAESTSKAFALSTFESATSCAPSSASKVPCPIQPAEEAQTGPVPEPHDWSLPFYEPAAIMRSITAIEVQPTRIPQPQLGQSTYKATPRNPIRIPRTNRAVLNAGLNNT